MKKTVTLESEDWEVIERYLILIENKFRIEGNENFVELNPVLERFLEEVG